MTLSNQINTALYVWLEKLTVTRHLLHIVAIIKTRSHNKKKLPWQKWTHDFSLLRDLREPDPIPPVEAVVVVSELRLVHAARGYRQGVPAAEYWRAGLNRARDHAQTLQEGRPACRRDDDIALCMV